MGVKRSGPTKSAKMVRPKHVIVMNGEWLRVTAVSWVEDTALGRLIVITCGERSFRRPPNAKIEVTK